MATIFIVLVLMACIGLGKPSALYFGCSEPQSPQHGGYSPTQYFYYVGSVIEFHCDDGYEVYGASWTVCIYNPIARKGLWIHSPPICKRKLNIQVTQSL